MEPLKLKNQYPNIPESTVETLEDNDIPLAQRALRHGYKTITREELFERLGASAIVEKVINDLKKESLSVIMKVMTINSSWQPRGVLKRYTFKSRKAKLKTFWEKCREVLWKAQWPSDDWERQDLDLGLDFCPVECYVGDIIPNRCLESLKEAKRIGLQNFHVVTLINSLNDPYPDPILVSGFGDLFFEIDLWE